jgi:hypothetical protein
VRDAEVREHAAFELGDLGDVAEERAVGRAGCRTAPFSPRAAKAASAASSLRDAAEAFLAGHRPALADEWSAGRRRCACGAAIRSVAESACARRASASERGRRPWRGRCCERAEDLQLLDGFGEVAAGQALVHVLVAREGAELVDAAP